MNTRYQLVGSCVLALMAVMFVALAIVALRQYDHVVESL